MTPLSTPTGRIALLAAQFNEEVTEGLLRGAQETLTAEGLTPEHLDILRVPGALELPLAALVWHERTPQPLAIIALGCVLRGETLHFEIVAQQSARALVDLSLGLRCPILNGVLACETLDQALARSAPNDNNKGHECARAALQMIPLMTAQKS